MKKIEEPDFKVSDVCDAVIVDVSTKEDKRIKDLFTQIDSAQWKNEIESCENEYHSNRNRLYDMKEMSGICEITVAQMKDVYSYSMSGSHGFRKRLYSLVPERCPICDKRWGFDDKNLDHILPKSKFPQFAITPYNLVPTCSTCNDRKNDDYGRDISTGVFNPYFHEIFLTRYMECYIYVSSGNIEVNVHLKSFDKCVIQDENKYKRMKYWFEELYNLDKIYKVNIENNINMLIDGFARSDLQESMISEVLLLEHFRKEYDKYRKFCFLDGIVSEEFLIFKMYESLVNKSTEELIELIKEKIISRKLEITTARSEGDF